MKGLIGMVMVLALLSGCATTVVYIPPSYPVPILDVATEIQAVSPYVMPQVILDCQDKSAAEQRVCRDRYLNAIIVGTDVRFMEYEGTLFDASQKASQPSTAETILKVVGMAAGTAGALAGGLVIPLVAAPFLAAGAGLLPGITGAVSPTPDPFFGRTLQTVDALMVAARAGILEEILVCQETAIEYCSLGRAVALADEYRGAGSIPGALREANEQAAIKTRDVKERTKTRMLRGLRP